MKTTGVALLAGLCGFLFLACAGSPSVKAAAADPALSQQDYRVMKLEELKALVADEPSKALDRALELLSRKPDLPSGDTPSPPSPEDLRGIVTAASGRLAERYSAAMSASDWKSALVALRSLRRLAGSELAAASLAPEAAALVADPGAREGSILERDAKSLLDSGYLVAALLVYERFLESADSPGPSDADLGAWAVRAVASGNSVIASRFAAELRKRGLALPKGAEALLSSTPTMQDMKKGVVTVRVDRGIKIQNGVGVPDRVLGTGFYIDPAGYVITNYHVIQSEVDPAYKGYSRLTIRPSDSPEDRIPAKVVGWDRLLDLALLKVEAKPDFVFSIDTAERRLQSGDRIFVIGSPVGLENTVTSGIVSAMGRRLLPTGDALQIDAALNPGNSGGPLLDEKGRVVGIVFAGVPSFEGLNFAIPSSWLAMILPDLFRGGQVTRSWLGLGLAPSGISGGRPPASAMEILYRFPGLSLGLETGERVLSVDDMAVAGIAEAQAILLGHGPGELVSVVVDGPSGRRKVLCALGERPYSPLEKAAATDRKDRLFPILFGMEVTAVPGTFLEPQAYKIRRVLAGSVADEAGLSEDDPFALRGFVVDKENRAILIQIHIKKRKAGFLESLIQLPAELDSPDFL
jgi:S1-C subfamily serine protease